MNFDFTIKMKDMISYYLKCIDIEMSSAKLTPQQYFEKHGLVKDAIAKTCCFYAYKDIYLEFILNRSFELGYLIKANDQILIQVNNELQTADLPMTYNGPIAECSADLD